MKAAPRILFVGNFLTRHWGRGRTGIDMRLMAGALRNNWQAFSFSERDIARFLAPLGVLRTVGARLMNARLVKTAVNWKPDVIFLGHCDYVTNAALAQIHARVRGVKIVHINCDPLASAHCRAQIARRVDSCDAIFLTTAGPKLATWKTPRNLVGFYPNPSDPSYEVEDNSTKTDFVWDLFFAGRPAPGEARKDLIDALVPKLPAGMHVGFFGMGGHPPVVGRAYEETLAVSKMGLSLNRYEGWKWYASDRITHLMGNGLLTFQYDGNDMTDFFAEDETVYFHGVDDLAEKIAFYQAHDEARRAVAGKGRAKYHTLFAAQRVVKYMVEAVLGETFSEPYEWAPALLR